MTTTASTTPTMAHTTLATTDPTAATDSYNIFEDSFAAFLRTSRNSRSLSTPTAAPQGLSPRVYGLSPRLPSALPPSASPQVLEPVTPDRQPVLPFYSVEDAVDFIPSDDVERAREKERRRRVEWSSALPPIRTAAVKDGCVDEEDADALFSNLSSRQPRTAAPLPMTAPDPVRVTTPGTDRQPVVGLQLPLELPPLRNPHAQTAPLPWDNERIAFKISASPPIPMGKDLSPLIRDAPELPELQLPTVTSLTNNINAFERPDCTMTSPRTTSPSVAAINAFMSSSSTLSGPTSSVSDIESAVTTKRPPRRPSDEMVDHSPPKRPSRVPISVPAGVGAGVAAEPPRCHLCGQIFARKSNLFKHLRSVHEETRRFACNQCSFKFKRQDHLIKHIRSVHSKVRKFSCDICGIGFAEKFNRDKHRRSIHETKRPFQCPCGAYFQDRDKMQNCLICKEGRSNF